MRTLVAFATALAALPIARAEAAGFYAERGHWTVSSGASACRALNRPAADFNASPFNALQIVVRPRSGIGVAVFFWPGALSATRDYGLRLGFAASEPVTVAARPAMGDYMLESGEEKALWQGFQKGGSVVVAVEGEPALTLHFGLDDMDWVLNALQSCVGFLPKG